MAAGNDAAVVTATAGPAYEVGGLEFTVNKKFLESWQFLTLQMQLTDPDVSDIGKLRVYMELLEGLTGLTVDDIEKAAGGEGASAAECIKLVTEILKAVSPKN